VALYTPFNELVEMVRNECAISSNSSRGNDQRDYLKQLIRRNYETLVDKEDWSFLVVDKDQAVVAMQAGERYYDFPVAMDERYAIEAWVFWGNVFLKLRYGIGPLEYSAYNSDNPQVRADPVLKWQIVESDKSVQFEVWPTPASNGDITVTPKSGQYVRFTGKRKARRMVQDSDPCDMDDQLLVLLTAGEVLERQEKGSGAVKIAAANDRLTVVKGMYCHHQKVRMGMGNGDNRMDGTSQGWPRIRVFPASN
jgi:hypothetical protein